jgi:hypothetical protein
MVQLINEHKELIAWLIGGGFAIWKTLDYFNLTRRNDKSELSKNAKFNEITGIELVDEYLEKAQTRIATFSKINDELQDLLIAERQEKQHYIERAEALESGMRRLKSMCLEFCPDSQFCQDKIESVINQYKID